MNTTPTPNAVKLNTRWSRFTGRRGRIAALRLSCKQPTMPRVTTDRAPAATGYRWYENAKAEPQVEDCFPEPVRQYAVLDA